MLHVKHQVRMGLIRFEVDWAVVQEDSKGIILDHSDDWTNYGTHLGHHRNFQYRMSVCNFPLSRGKTFFLFEDSIA